MQSNIAHFRETRLLLIAFIFSKVHIYITIAGVMRRNSVHLKQFSTWVPNPMEPIAGVMYL